VGGGGVGDRSHSSTLNSSYLHHNTRYEDKKYVRGITEISISSAKFYLLQNLGVETQNRDARVELVRP
jgi:hypothetical protein